ncbi:ABC transporter ATP-binding protein [Novisyntrophococcus fermenticellae]|uniref:ABC transporter ATP-binding protein n=1 Tax=Novisyntrophococcus fermenticellae TaxID=2068655 RepID=UPI001E31ED5C|nr:ABC transporter ATP-binding protein [Novisyntrophococcus fermenticellae]
MGNVTIENIIKDFKDIKVLKDISIHIPDGSFTVLLGPSGCGKSTLLRIVAGLEKPDSGDIYIGDENVTKEEPKDRGVAMVFQNYALYPHMTAAENIEYGLKVKKIPKPERKRMVEEALEMVDLADQSAKRPAHMSGGQRQRVALARAIVKKPEVFLMDEPLSNLDAKLRNQMREKISMLHKSLKTTFIYVTHDQVEAMSMGNNIIILHNGVISQQGTPKGIYTNPDNIFVAGFIGSPPSNVIQYKNKYIAVKPEEIILTEDEKKGICLKADILSMEQLGSDTIYSMNTKIGNLKVKASCTWMENGESTKICIPYQKILYFGKDGNRTESTLECQKELAEYCKEE